MACIKLTSSTVFLIRSKIGGHGPDDIRDFLAERLQRVSQSTILLITAPGYSRLGSAIVHGVDADETSDTRLRSYP